MKTIDITPTWEGLVPFFITMIENGTPKGRADAIKELTRMAKIADHAVAEAKRMDAERARFDRINELDVMMGAIEQ